MVLNKSMKVKRLNKFIITFYVILIILFSYHQIPLRIELRNNIYEGTEFYSLNTGQTSHAPISINGNGELTEINGVKNETALGTEDDPFIIENYYISSGGSSGIYLRNINYYVSIQNCIITGSSYYGIYIYNCINLIIQNNTIDNFSYGIRLYNSNNTKVELNYANDQSVAGIQLEECNKSIILNNEIVNSWDSGIVIENSDNCNLISNTCHNNDAYGIELDGAVDCLLKRNTNYQQLSGIFLSSTEYCNITENKCFHNEYYGLQFSSNNGINTIFNNTFSKNYWYGIYLYTNQYNEIYGNDLSLNGNGPFTYSQSYSDNLHNNILQQPNEMNNTGLPNLELGDKTKSYSKIFTLNTFDSGGAGLYKLSFEFSCQKIDPNNLIVRMDAFIDTMSGSFFQLKGATFIYDVSLDYNGERYVSFGYKTDSTSTIEFSSTIYKFPMCAQVISLNSQTKDFTVNISYLLKSSTWGTINSTFSENITVGFSEGDNGNPEIPGFNLFFVALSSIGLVIFLTSKIRKKV